MEGPSALAHNRAFRRLWLGDATSLLGDWFTYVAVGTLAVAADRGLIAVAVVLLGHSLPRALVAPLAGRLADRHDRRAILIIGSLLRALTVLAMIVAAWAEALAAVQVLVFVRMAFGGLIEPAATAMLPQLVPREQVGRANAVLGATWSVMFAIGVAAGGLMTALVGPIAALAIDGLTFAIAALVFATLPRALPSPPSEGRRSRVDEHGWRIAWARPDILGSALAKLPAALANGGAWVLLHDLARADYFGTTAIGLGILHAARAVGTGLGPLLWIGCLRGSPSGLRASVGVTLVAVAVLAVADTPALILAATVAWGIGTGANWVTASTRMQVLSANDQLGRVASVDLFTQSLAQGVGGLVGAWLADHWSDPTLSAWWGAAGGLLGWLGVGALVRLSARSRRSEASS